MNDISGPVGIVDMIGDSYEASVSVGYYEAFLQMLYITILLSANLGVMNLLPFPALDGGRFAFLAIEAVCGKPIDRKVESYVNFAGIISCTILSCSVMVTPPHMEL